MRKSTIARRRLRSGHPHLSIKKANHKCLFIRSSTTAERLTELAASYLKQLPQTVLDADFSIGATTVKLRTSEAIENDIC